MELYAVRGGSVGNGEKWNVNSEGITAWCGDRA